MKVGFVSLGCSKNLVDTEMCIHLFQENEFTIVNQPEQADIIVINTCGFIDSAKQEGINTILEMAEYKKKNCKCLIVMGCLVERYETELKKLLPEVDLFIPIKEYKNLWEKIAKKLNLQAKNNCQMDYFKRTITTGNKTAYLKIAEGCSNYCTYCAIPYIRGKYQSREKEEILEEAKQLASKGIQELIVIAQDTTKYGVDLYGKEMLAELLKELEKIEGIHWIRFLYAYPESITRELIQVVKNSKKICHYFDIPIQHISDCVLKRMNRKSDGASIKRTIKKIRQEIPDVIIRTTLILGFPGETQEEFEELYHFVEQEKFDRLGAFAYSKEEGTPAANFKDQIHPATKKARWKKIMELQKEIVEENMKKYIGTKQEVLIEAEEKDCYIARSKMDVPDMDGVIYVEKNKSIHIGDFVEVEITGTEEYDMMAKK